MEVRSSRRVRTLVTQMARSGLSANEIAPALIPMMARSETLQSKAGYIDARPLTANSSKSSCYARPDHTFGVKPGLPPWGPHVRFRRVQTLVREGSPLVKLRNSA